MSGPTPFSGSVVLVTGGGSGIGRELTRALAARGARVVAADLNGPSAERAAADAGSGAVGRALDVRDAAAFERVVADTEEHVGPIDYFFNNAGMGVGGEVHETTLAHWDRVIDVNIRGVIHGVHAVYPRMVKRRSGHIVNTASIAGLVPTPLLVAYGMSKHAVVGLGQGLRMEAEAYGVKVSTLCPSAIETPLLDSKNPGDLPAPRWEPDFRRFITSVTGPAYPVDRLVEDTLEGVLRNDDLIIVPTRARVAWHVGQALPGLLDVISKRAVAKERKRRP